MFCLLVCVKHGLLLSWNTLFSARTIVYVLPPQDGLIKSQRSCGQLVHGSSFIQSDCSKQIPVALFIWALFCRDRPQCFLHCHSLIGMHTSRIYEITTNQTTHSHTHWIMQPKIKPPQTPQAHNEMSFRSQTVAETWLATSAFQCLGLKVKSSRLTEKYERWDIWMDVNTL